MYRSIRELFVALLLLGPIVAFAQSEGNKTLTAVGQQLNYVYIAFAEGLSLPCAYATLYIDTTTTYGKQMLAHVLAAKYAGKKISRVDYTQAASGTCYMELIEVNQ